MIAYFSTVIVFSLLLGTALVVRNRPRKLLNLGFIIVLTASIASHLVLFWSISKSMNEQ